MQKKNCVWLGGVFVFALLACPGRAEEGKKEFTAVLSDGTIVELIGLRYYGARDLEPFKGNKTLPWWNPEGLALAKLPDKWNGRTSRSDSYIFVICIKGTGNYSCKAVGPWGADLNVQAVESKGEGFEDDDLRRFTLRFSPDQKEADIRVGLALGDWKIVEDWPFWENATPDSSFFVSEEEVIMRCPEQKGSDVVAEITQTLVDEATRLVIFDRDGNRHESLRESGGESGRLIRYIHRFKDLDKDNIERIKFQKRPYDYWITFKNVSLEPGHETKVQVAVEKSGTSLVGKALPDLEDLKVTLSPDDSKGKKILVCFWDMGQRPSRHCVRELAKKAEQLKEKGVSIVAVQSSKTDKGKLNKWVEENNIDFAVGMIGGDAEKAKFSWGVKSLPWLILTDKEHIVRAEGFGLEELDEKLKEINGE